MDKVTNINSRRLFGEFYPRAPERVPEGMRFVAYAALTFVAPTLALCHVTNQTEPLYLMVSNLLVGTILGISRYLQPLADSLSCVPARRITLASGDKRKKDAA